MMTQPPSWQPTRSLPMLASALDGLLDAVTTNRGRLQQARLRPYILDDATISQISEVYCRHQADMPLYEEQLWRWRVSTITTAQRQEVARLMGQVQRLRTVLAEVLLLIAEMKQGSSDAIRILCEEESIFDVLPDEEGH